MDVYQSFRNDAASAVAKASGLSREDVLALMEKPPEGIDADIAFPCFALAKKMKKGPVEIAKGLAEGLGAPGMMVRAMGPYVNFNIDWRGAGEKLLRSVARGYGSGKSGKKVLVEHTSANPDGPLHLGHFRNSVLGDSIARILRFSGDSVRTEFFVNDTGRQIAIASMENERTHKPVKEKPDWWVVDLYVAGNKRLEKEPELNSELQSLMSGYEKGDRETIRKYKVIVDNCLKGHKETLSMLGIRIDSFRKESDFVLGKGLSELYAKLGKLKQANHDGKRLWINLKDYGIDREFTLTRSDGTSIYPARDIAYHLDKFSRAKRNINVIGTDQKFYFRQVKSVLGLLQPAKAKNYDIVFYEFLLLPEGSMSTRRGNFLSMDDLIDNALEAAKKVVEEKMPHYPKKQKDEIANMVGIGALKYAMLKVSPEKTYSFSIKDALSFDGDTAPYIQYTHARACSILRKARTRGAPEIPQLHDKEKELLKELAGFPETARNAARDLRPHYVANYCYKLAKLFNEFYHELPVLKAEPAQREFRLALTSAVRTVLAESLGLLGIDSPEKM